MRALVLALVACGGASTRAPAPPTNHGGIEAPSAAHELRLDITDLPHEVEIDPVAPIELVVTSRVTGAEVIVDGEVVGSTPVRVRVRAGKHQVRVHAEGY
jgi:hypothetical protein